MHANEMTFGIEIETHMPAGSVAPGSHGFGRQVEWLPAGWLADEDPSIVVPHSGRVKCEFVSPVLKGAEGLRQAVEAIAEIKRRGGQVNASCGLHVHVGFDKSNTTAIGNLITLVSNHEKALYAATGTTSRERGVGSRFNTCWCKSVKQYGSKARATRTLTGTGDRYHILNLNTGNKPTVEFRVFGGSLNTTKVAGYVRLCVGLVEKSLTMKKACPFVARQTRSTTRAAAGVGYAEMLRMLGNITTLRNTIEGDGIPTFAASKRILRKMAKQYDAQPNG